MQGFGAGLSECAGARSQWNVGMDSWRFVDGENLACHAGCHHRRWYSIDSTLAWIPQVWGLAR